MRCLFHITTHMKNFILVIAGILSISLNVCCQDRFPVRQLTFDPAQEGFATWSPDGKFIVFQHTDMYDTLGNNGLWKIQVEGGEPEQLYSGLAEHPRWSPDGRWIVFDADTGKSIQMIPAAGGDVIRFLPDTIPVRNGGLPCWSPDGKKIAFVGGSLRSLYIADMITGKFNRIFSREGTIPLPGGWTNDGNWILTALMEMPSRKSTIWKISSDGKEKKQITGHDENFYRHLALSPDGEWIASPKWIH